MRATAGRTPTPPAAARSSAPSSPPRATATSRALLALLDPDVVLRSDDAAAASGSPAEVLGAAAVARTFAGRARAARLALVDGVPGLVWSQGGVPRVVFGFTVADGRIVAVDVIADAAALGDLEIEYPA